MKKNQLPRTSRLLIYCFISFILTLVSHGLHAQTNHPVISQVYGGGGNTGATYTHDFIEIFNPHTSTINVGGWSVQYASSTGTTWQVTALPSVNLAPGQYLLIQEAQGSSGTTALPTPDATGTISMSATAGKVALVSTTTALSGACPSVGVVDFVGFGSGANCFEGSGPTAAPSNTNGVIRNANGCTDTNNNSADFSVVLPTPRNTSSPLNPCSSPVPTIVSFSPTSACAGSNASVIIIGTNFSGVTMVDFNGNAASFSINSSTQITATLPAGASTGPVHVSDGTNIATSASSFTVNPLPGAVIVTGGGSFCGNTTINASGGSGGTIYFQGTTSGGMLTGTPSTSQLVSSSGTYFFRAQTAAGCWGPEGSVTVTITSAAAPVTVFTETMGTVTGNTAIATHEAANGFDNIPFTMTGTGDVRTTSASSGYTGASGGANIFLTNNGTANFQIADINTSAYQQLTLSFGVLKSTTASNGSELLVETSSDGTNYTPVSMPALPTGGGTAVWTYNTATSVIYGTANLRIRFTNTASSGPQFRIDDVKLVGANPSSTITANGPTSFCPGGSVILTAPNASSYLWSNSATTQSITVNNAGSFSCQLTLPNTCIVTSNTINTTLNSAPTFTSCPSNISDFSGSGSCSNIINYTAVASGTPAPSLTYSLSGATGGSGSGSGTGSGLAFNVGVTNVSITATNTCGTATCSFSVTITDNTPPTAVCQNTTVYLDGNGNASVTASQINNGSSDACGIASVSVSPSTFNCSNVNTVVAPSIWINEIHYDNFSTDVNEFIELAGTAGINLANYALVRYNGSNPDAAVMYTSPAQLTTLTGTIPDQSNGYGTFAVFYAQDGLQNGTADGVALVNTSTNAVIQLLSYEGTFTVASGQGLASGMTSTDIGVSEAGSLSGGSVRLTGTGNQYGSFTWQPESAPASPGAINPGQIFPSSANTVVLTVTDNNGNSSTCSAMVTVLDNTPPVANCQNIIVELDETGNATITAAQVDNNSTDNCTVTNMSVSPGAFTCANLGANTVVLTVTDGSGNTSTCTATVTVQDNVPPVAVAHGVTVILDATGKGSIIASQVDGGSSDNCGIASINVSPSTFNCSDIHSGASKATGLFFSEYVEGSLNNKYIEIFNGTGASVNLANYQLQLFANGSATPTTTNTLSGMLTSGSTVVYRNSSATIYGGPGTNLSAVNWNGDDAIALYNTLTGQHEDIFGVIGNDPGSAWTGAGGYSTMDKTLRRKSNVTQGVTVNPGGTGPGAFTTLTTEWDLFDTDDVSGLGNHSFIPPAATLVTFTVTDNSGNTSTVNAGVVVIDNINPVITCPAPINISNDAGLCGATVTYNVMSSDNCTPTLTQTSGLPSGAVFPIGTTVNSFVATDASGNSASCSFSVTVIDNENPKITNVPASFSSCNPVNWTPPTITDNCPGVQINSNYSPGSTFPSGTTTVTYTATDVYGHTTTASFQVTVLEPSVAATGIQSNRDYNNICRGENITLSVVGGSLGEGASWIWYSGSCGGTYVGTGSSIMISPQNTTTYFARAEGTCNNTTCVQIQVVVSTTAPTATAVFSYVPAFGAPGVMDSAKVNPVTGATYYRWFTNNGQLNGVLFNGNVSPVETSIPKVDISFILPQQNYQIRVIAGNACGRNSQANATVRGTVEAPTSLSGPTSVCAGSSASYTVSAIPPVSGNTPVTYNWALIPSNAGTISGSGLTRTVNFASGFTTAQLCVNGVSSFGLAGAPYCITINNSAPVPGPVSGNASPCVNTTEVYSIADVPGASGYVWGSSVLGAVITPDVSGTSATVQWPSSAFSGNLCVQANSICGLSAPSCILVESGAAGTPGPVVGPANGICGGTNVNYAVSAPGAISYDWVLPANVTLTGSSNSSSVGLNFLPGFTSGMITVEVNYGCGMNSSSLMVDGSPAVPVVTPATICAGMDELYYATSATPVLSFNWSISGATYENCQDGSYCSFHYIIWSSLGGSFDVTATNLCGTSAPFHLSTNCRIEEQGTPEAVLFPNPTTGVTTLEFMTQKGTGYQIRVSDLAGRTVHEIGAEGNGGWLRQQIDMTLAGEGIYLLQVSDNQGLILVKKLSVK